MEHGYLHRETDQSRKDLEEEHYRWVKHKSKVSELCVHMMCLTDEKKPKYLEQREGKGGVRSVRQRSRY